MHLTNGNIVVNHLTISQSSHRNIQQKILQLNFLYDLFLIKLYHEYAY